MLFLKEIFQSFNFCHMLHQQTSLPHIVYTTILLVICGVLPGALYAQLPYMTQSNVNAPDQAIYLEVGGNGITYSMNYDLRFENNYGIRLGISGYPPTDSDRIQNRSYQDFRDNQFLFAVIMGNYFIGNQTSSLELGAGVVLGDVEDKENWSFPLPNAATFTAGYRYMNKKKWKPTFKAGLTPMIGFNGKAHMRIGISIGFMISGDE